MENKSIEELLKDLESSDESKRVYAVEDLSEFNDVKIGPAIIDMMLKEKSQLVREAIVDALQQIISPEIYDGIYEMFSSKEAFTRNAAIKIFADGGDDAINYLGKSYPGSNKEVRKLILDSLFEIGTPLAVKTMRLGLYDRDMNVNITSIEYLGRLNDYQSGSRLVEILKDADQPMLVISLLESISRTCNSEWIRQAIEIILPDNNNKTINNLYLCEILNLTAMEGSVEDILKILELNIDYNIYSEDISVLLRKSNKRYPEILSIERFRETILKLLNSENINSNTLLNLFHLLEECKNKIISSRVKKLTSEDIWEEKLLKHELVELLKREWYGINI